VNAAVNDPTSLLPEQAKQAIEIVQDCDEKIISALPISETQKTQLTSAVSSVKERVVKKMEASPTGTLLTSVLGTKPVTPKPVESKPVVSKTVAAKPVESKQETQQSEESAPVELVQEESAPVEETKPEVEPSLVTVQINPEDIAAVQAFLAAKHANTTT
jgi:hypothetical protein